MALSPHQREATMGAVLVLVIAALMWLLSAPAEAHESRHDWWFEAKGAGPMTLELLEARQAYYDWLVEHNELRDLNGPYTVPRTRVRSAGNPTRAIPPASAVSPGVEQWRSLVAAYFAPEHVDKALRVINCESRGDPNAKNPRSTASGLFQHLASYWDDRSVRAGWAGASIWDPEANVAVGAWLYYLDGWGHWPNCGKR